MEWNEWRLKANNSYKKGLYTIQNMVQDWGFPTDLDPKIVNLLFRNGKVGTKSRKSRAVSKKVNAFTRKRAEQITLPEHKKDPVNRRELQRQIRDRALANRQHGAGSYHLDHEYSQNQLNQKTNGQGPRIRNKTIRGIEAEVGHPVGEHYLNKNLRTAQENQLRNELDLKKNSPTRISRAPDKIRTSPFKPSVIGGAAKVSYGLSMIAEYLPAIDEITGGHIDVAIQNGVNGIRNVVGLESNPVVRNTPEREVSESLAKIARSQEAIKNGGTMKLGPITLPEFGISELIGF